MSKIDWNSESITVEEILRYFLSDILEEKYKYTDDVNSNPLESVLASAILEHDFNSLNVVGLMKLDNAGITGEKILKLWYLCDEDSEYFKKTVSYITGTMLDRAFTLEEVIKNLELESPIKFIPKDESVPTFNKLSSMRHEIGNDEVDEIIYLLRKNLISSYNRYVNFYNLNNELMDELPPFEKSVVSELDKNDLVDIRRLYFGESLVDLSGGILGINMNTYNLFLKSLNSIKVFGNTLYYIKDIPSGDVILVDSCGEKVELDNEVEVDGVSILPTHKYTRVSICSIRQLIEEAKERGISNEFIDLYDSMLFRNEFDLTVGKCCEFLNTLSDMYRTINGSLGNDNNKKR